MAESVEPTESLISQQTNGDVSKADGAGQTLWDNFSQWLCAVCVVTFDLELGQALEVHIYLLCALYRVATTFSIAS